MASRRDEGKRIYREVMCADPPARSSIFVNVGQLDQAFAEVWSRTDQLSRKDRRWITLACLAARSVAAPLREHVYGALASGDITPDELMEGVLHFGIYGGFAHAEVFDAVLGDVMDELNLSTSERIDMSSYLWASEDERETAAAESQRNVFPATSRSAAPLDMSTLNRHGTRAVVYAELWARGGLSRRERRLISLACAAMSGSVRPTETHWQGALDSGDLTIEELGEFALQFAFYAGWPQAQVLPSQTATPTR